MGFPAGKRVWKVQGGATGVASAWGTRPVQWWLVPERVGRSGRAWSQSGAGSRPRKVHPWGAEQALTLVLMFLARPA